MEDEPVQFVRIKSLSPTLVLELIESILLNNARLFSSHPELTQLLRVNLVPLTVRYFSERHTFAQSVRVARILLLILKRHMPLLIAECEMALGLLTHLLEPDGATSWKRILCMEVFRGLYTEPWLIRLVYSLYDETDGRKSILKDHMSVLVRLASERPSLIGVNTQSTVPSRAERTKSTTEEQIALETGGVAGMFGTMGPSAAMDVPGISSEWSVVRTPYIELLDKTDPPRPPETYIYSLILNCISALSEGLAKFILPLTVPELKQKRKNRTANPEQSPGRDLQDLRRSDSWKTAQNSSPRKSPVPINPLDLENHPQLSAIKACAGIINDCWPAILAACSTFLYASLDDEFYHILVRSFQKLTHVAGLLRLSVSRDAFLTALGKAAMPTDTGGVKSISRASTISTESPHKSNNEEKREEKVASIARPSLSLETSNIRPEGSFMSLSTRNLLCLRALLNLGIALGPTLDQPAWSIILETLRDADLMIGMSSATTRPIASSNSPVEAAASPGADIPKANIGGEIVAVQTASIKLFESTSDYPSDSFENVLVALLGLSDSTAETLQHDPKQSTDFPISSQGRVDRHRENAHLVSQTVGKSRLQEEEFRFVLEREEDLARANLSRLSSLAENERSAWRVLTSSLISSIANSEISSGLRLKASNVLNDIIFQTMGQSPDGSSSIRNELQVRNLQTLQSQIKSLHEKNASRPRASPTTVIEIHERGLEVLKNILEQYAETFTEAWNLIFDLISSIFERPPTNEGRAQLGNERMMPVQAVSPRLVRTAYKSLQLVASDFLSLLPSPCLLTLVNSFSNFASQQQDFNISLTTTSFFWNISDFLEKQTEKFSIEDHASASVSEEELVTLAKKDDPSASRNSLWLLLLLRIVDVTTDGRTEIRNSAVRTLLRIFDAYGQQLSPKAWHLCLNRVLFRMVEEIESKLIRVNDKSNGSNSEELKAWVDTTVVMIKGCSDLITSFFETIVQDEEFDKSWERLLRYFRTLVDLNFLEFNEATFSSLSSILLRAGDSHNLSNGALQVAWSLWADGHPASKEDLLDLDRSNQDAGLAYLHTFEQIYRLYKGHLTEGHIETAVQHMRILVWNSVPPRYSPDVDRLSTLQALVVDCIKMICLEKDTSQPQILLCLADFVDSALLRWSPGTDTRRPTFVAFSKRTTEILDWYITEVGIKRDIFANGALGTVLEHLSTPIIQKYEWQGKDREPNLWQKATTASLDILQVAIPYVEKQYEESTQSENSRFWKCVVHIAQGIVSARGPRTVELSTPSIRSDETFDTGAFNRLKTLIFPSLGAATIPDSIRREFASALFHSSFIYPPQRFDLPNISLVDNDTLRDIGKIRPGRTFDPSPTLRPNMAYVLVNTLFELASIPQASTENQSGSLLDTTTDNTNTNTNNASTEPSSTPRLLLSRSVAPYLILRCAVSLKAYIADQPLRGQMPQPIPARRELLHLLTSMIELQSEPSAIPEPPGTRNVVSMSNTGPESGAGVNVQCYKKHLEWVYPLIVKAVQVAGKERDDGRVLWALGKVLEQVGSWGL